MDILTGFLTADGNALGRPVGVVIDNAGALLVADDVGNRVWRVTGSSRNQMTSVEEHLQEPGHSKQP